VDKNKLALQGSEKRDIFKRMHKRLSGSFYACDADFCLVSKYPPGTVAYFDYKTTRDHVSFSEGIQYNEWAKTAPVFIVEGNDPENGPFTIRRYTTANWKPHPPVVSWGKTITVKDWIEFGKWEQGLRERYGKQNGWHGDSENWGV